MATPPNASSKFLSSFGFAENPFASTNADKEPHLSQYFVPPPYFTSVKGDPKSPKSNVVLAPRGGGKTAQKVMIEDFAAHDESAPYCVAYDSFRSVTRQRLGSLTLEWHLEQIIQRILSGVVTLIDQGHGANLSASQKRVLSYSFPRFLGNLSAADAEQVFSSVKSFSNKATDFAKKNGRNILSVVLAIAQVWGAGKAEIEKIGIELKDEPLTYILGRLVEVVQSFGFTSVYVLIDRTDEIPELSSDASLCAKFVEPILSNLHLLEMPGIAFKVFLWDKTEDYLIAGGFRRDRVPVYMLNWTQAELEDMLSRRVRAFSGGRIASVNDLIDISVKYDLHRLACYLSKGSPRDVIRLMGRIIDEHTRVEDTAAPLTKASIESGIRKYSRERALELYGGRLEDLVKIGLVSFTIGEVANDIFRINHQSARNKIQNLMSVGAVIKSGEIENPGNRPLHQYSLDDPRLPFVVLSTYTVEDIIGYYLHICPRCASLIVREGDEIACDECSLEFVPTNNNSVLAHCKRNGSPELPLASK